MIDEEEFRRRAVGIRLLVLDVDGVLTDGSILVHDDGSETKRFCVQDGFALAAWRRSGGKVAVLSGRTSAAVAARGKELGFDALVQGQPLKAAAYGRLLAEFGFLPRQACVMGDDVPDLPILLDAGIAAAPADAVPEVLERVDWISSRPGGKGAVRELVQKLLSGDERWNEVVAHYARPASLWPKS